MRRTYLDHNASSPLHPAARAALEHAFAEPLGNPSSPHAEGRRARDLLEAARERVATVLGCRGREVLFTSGGTEALNLGLVGAARARAAVGRRVVVTAIEHAAVLDPASALGREGYEIARVPPRQDGSVDGAAILEACGPGTTVAAVMLANHETGALLPVAQVAAGARPRGVLVLCDAAMGVGLVDLRVDRLGVDLLALSGHKFGAPPGIGALYVRRRTKLEPLLRGGPQEEQIRGGTENVAGAAALAAALEAMETGRSARVERLRALTDRLRAGLAAIRGAVVLGPSQERLPTTVNVAIEGCEGEALLVNLDLAGIAVSTGSACAVGASEASPVLLAMGLPPRVASSTIRLSLGEASAPADVEEVLRILPSIVARLRDLAR